MVCVNSLFSYSIKTPSPHTMEQEALHFISLKTYLYIFNLSVKCLDYKHPPSIKVSWVRVDFVSPLESLVHPCVCIGSDRRQWLLFCHRYLPLRKLVCITTTPPPHEEYPCAFLFSRSPLIESKIQGWMGSSEDSPPQTLFLTPQ